MSPRKVFPLLVVLAAAVGLQGCLAVAAGGLVVGTAGAVVGTTAKVGGAVIGAAIPDGNRKKQKGKDRD